MLPNPLHPAVVHFPIVLAFLLPLFALGALVAIRKGARPLRAWSIPLGFAAALTLSSWIAVQTGEGEGERVERVVAEQPLESHEESAELFLTLSGVLLLVAGVGLAPGMVGRAGRITASVGAVALVVAAANVGHSGGELVYRYGAASAYAPADSLAGRNAGAANAANRDRLADVEGNPNR
ncbi:MAG: DUF2231 domain-containing protein [Gemmatimonadaceae bacterium]